MRLYAVLSKHHLHVKDLRPRWRLGEFDHWAEKVRHLWVAEKHRLRVATRRSANEKRSGMEVAKKTKKSVEIKVHSSACIFRISQTDLNAMIEDIKANGQRVPGKAWKNPTTGEIELVDGRIRASACDALGMDFNYEIIDLADDLEVLRLINSLNVSRRHVNQSQKAMIGARQVPLFSAAAKQRQLAGKANLPGGQKGQARDVVAKMLNVSSRLIQEGITVLRCGCGELIEAVESGRKAVSSAAIIAEKLKDDKEYQKRIVEMTDEGFNFAVKSIRPTPGVGNRNDRGRVEEQAASDSQRTVKATKGPVGQGEGGSTGEASSGARSSDSEKPPEDAPEQPNKPVESAEGSADPAAGATPRDGEQGSRRVEEQEEEGEPMPPWLLAGLRRHRAILPYAESARVTYNKNGNRAEIVLTRRKKKLPRIAPTWRAQEDCIGQTESADNDPASLTASVDDKSGSDDLKLVVRQIEAYYQGQGRTYSEEWLALRDQWVASKLKASHVCRLVERWDEKLVGDQQPRLPTIDYLIKDRVEVKKALREIWSANCEELGL
jgi:hypothetical protein